MSGCSVCGSLRQNRKNESEKLIGSLWTQLKQTGMWLAEAKSDDQDGGVIGFSLNSLPRGDEGGIWLLSAGLASPLSSDICPVFFSSSCWQRDEVFNKISHISAVSVWHGACWDRGQHCSEHTFPTPSFHHSNIPAFSCCTVLPSAPCFFVGFCPKWAEWVWEPTLVCLLFKIHKLQQQALVL